MMALSTIDRVREAEIKANDRQDKVQAQAEQIVADAKHQAADLIGKAKQQAADFDKRAAAEAQSRANDMIKQRRAHAEEAAATLFEKTLKLKQKVIDKLIMETLV